MEWSTRPINVVEYRVMEVDDVEVQIQEAAGEENGLLGQTFSQI